MAMICLSGHRDGFGAEGYSPEQVFPGGIMTKGLARLPCEHRTISEILPSNRRLTANFSARGKRTSSLAFSFCEPWKYHLPPPRCPGFLDFSVINLSWLKWGLISLKLSPILEWNFRWQEGTFSPERLHYSVVSGIEIVWLCPPLGDLSENEMYLSWGPPSEHNWNIFVTAVAL